MPAQHFFETLNRGVIVQVVEAIKSNLILRVGWPEGSLVAGISSRASRATELPTVSCQR